MDLWNQVTKFFGSVLSGFFFDNLSGLTPLSFLFFSFLIFFFGKRFFL